MIGRVLLSIGLVVAAGAANATTSFSVLEPEFGNGPDFSVSGSGNGSVTTPNGGHYSFTFLKTPSPTVIVYGTGSGNNHSSSFSAQFDYTIRVRSNYMIPTAFASCATGPGLPPCVPANQTHVPDTVGYITGQTYLTGSEYFTSVEAASLIDVSPPHFCDGLYCSPTSDYTIPVGGGVAGFVTNGNGGLDYVLDIPISLRVAGASFGSASDWTLGAVDPVFTLDQGFLNALDPNAQVSVEYGDLGNAPNPNFAAQVAAIAAVPEPATWATMLGGFGLIGAAARRRRDRTFASA